MDSSLNLKRCAVIFIGNIINGIASIIKISQKFESAAIAQVPDEPE
jgi:hypothetical protein